ncbi:hypothetical protein GW17_00027385 [Ensete ventricosum]|nr:hypothetical protein GW17_00027385 [Ensete ventricosum]
MYGHHLSIVGGRQILNLAERGASIYLITGKRYNYADIGLLADIGMLHNEGGSDSAQQQFPNQSRPSMTQEQFVLFSASKRMKQRWAILTCSKGWCSAFESWQCFWRIPSRNDADRVQRHRVGPGKEINQSDWLLMSIISQRGSERKLAFHGMQQQCMHQRAEMSWNKPTLLAFSKSLQENKASEQEHTAEKK